MSTSVAVCRDIYTEDRFRQTYGSADATSHNEGIRETLSRRCTCADGACLHLLKERVPVLAWLPRYRLRKWLLGDLVAGVTVGIVHIPQGMAFALLTSVAPVYGLYTSFLPVVLYMLLGTGRHVSTGTFAVLSLMTGSVVDTLVPTPPQLNTSVAEVTALQAQRIGVASAVAFLSGAMMLFMFSLQLGFLSTFLSEPIVKAFTSAAAFHVTVSQLQSMLGLQLPRQTGQFSLFKTLAAVLENLPLTNLAELGISLACLALLVPVREMNARCRHRLRTPVPMEIVTVIVATGVAYGLSLDAEYGVQIVGPIPAGFPRPVLPSLRLLPDVAADAAAITAVSYAVSVSLAMIYADKHGYTIQPNQELFAHGISNTVSSLFTCFPSSATLATTNILESAGGHTQLAGLFTSLVVLVVLMLIGPLFHFLPKAVLACINVTSLRQMFLQLQDLPDLWRISRMDFVVWVVTWLSVVVLSVDVGLAIGVVFSMMTVICRTQRAGCWVLGRASNTEIYRPLDLHSKCSEVPGLRILAYNGPIYYGNRSFFRSRVSRLLGMSPERTHSVSHANRAHIAHSAAERSQREVVSTVDRGVANASFSPGNEFIKPEVAGTERQAVLIDCSSVIFVDVAGAKLFVQMCVDCQKGGMQMFLAGCNESVLKILTSSGLMQHMRPHHIFVTVHDAVVYVQQQREKHVEDSSPPCV